MTIKVASIAQTKAEVIRLAQADPDFVYADQEGGDGSCGYGGRGAETTKGRPCIIGQALINLGSDRKELSWVPGTVGINAYQFFTNSSPLEEDALNDLKFLSIVQMNQDSGYSWGEALDKALNDE